MPFYDTMKHLSNYAPFHFSEFHAQVAEFFIVFLSQSWSLFVSER